MKLQNTFIKGKMNKDFDERMIPNGEHRHALNINIATSSDGNVGAIEPAFGNKILADHGVTNGICIGEAKDEKDDFIYYLIKSDTKDLVVEFDTSIDTLVDSGTTDGTTANKLVDSTQNFVATITMGDIVHNTTDGTYAKVTAIDDNFTLSLDTDIMVSGEDYIIETSAAVAILEDTAGRVLKFDEDYLVTGMNVISYEDSSLKQLAWTDNLNNPRKIYIETAKSFVLDGFDEDDISVIKRPPVREPSISLAYDSSVVRNTVQNKYFIFSYRYIYEGNEVSSFSFASEASNIFTTDDDINATYNAIDITVATGDSRVKEIDIIYNEVGSNTVYLIKRLNKADNSPVIADNTSYIYRFKNDKQYSAISEDDVDLLFSNVPRIAKTQDIVGNRLTYFNYKEGYDLGVVPDFSASKTYSALSAPTTLVSTYGAPAFGGAGEWLIEFGATTFTEGQLIKFSTKVSPALYRYTEFILDYVCYQNYFDIANLFADLGPWLQESFAMKGFTATVTLVGTQVKIALSTALFYTFYYWFPQYCAIYDKLALSYKSQRSQEFGLVYYDKYNRRSSVVESDAKVYFEEIKIGRSGQEIGGVDITIAHAPPTWAEKYKVVRKVNTYKYEVTSPTMVWDFVNNEDFYITTTDKDTDKYAVDDVIDIIYQTNVAATLVTYATTNVRFKITEIGTTADLLSGLTYGTEELFQLALKVRIISGGMSGFTSAATGEATPYDGYRYGGIVSYVEKEIDPPADIYYEIPTTYDITGGNHMGDSGHGDTDQVVGVTDAVLSLYDGDVFFIDFKIERYKVNLDFNSTKFNNLNTLRPNAFSTTVGEVTRQASITYSEVFREDTSFNGLGVFNTSKENYKDLDLQKGSIQIGVARYGDIFIAQEDKLSVVLFGRDLLTDAGGAESLTAVSQVLGRQMYIPVDNGISQNPESFVRYDGWMIMTDSSRGEVLMVNGNEVKKISREGMNDYFKDKMISNPDTKKFGGYDPRTNEYIISIDDETVAFNVLNNTWTTFYSYLPENMTFINGNMYSFKDGKLHIHNNTVTGYCNFYNTKYGMEMTLMINAHPTEIKEFLTLELAGTHAWSANIKALVSGEDDYIESNIINTEFNKTEGIWYAYTRRNESTTNFESKATYGVGKITAINALTITINGGSSLLTVGDALHRGSDLSLIGTITAINDSDITLDAIGTAVVTDYIFGKKNARIEGGNLRGYVAEVNLTLDTTDKVELYSIGTEVIKSF